MRSFVQDYMTKPYQEDVDGRLDLEEGTLAGVANASIYRRGEIPEGCDLVTLTADIQLRRHYWLSVAFDAEDRWHIVDWGRDAICGDMEQPNVDQRHAGLARLDDLARGGWKTGDGKVLLPHGGIDTGFKPEELRPWIARNRQRWLAIKGAGEELVSRMVRAPIGTRQTYEERWYDLRKQEESPDRMQLFVAADDILDRIAADWKSGRANLPADADRELIRHLTGMRPGEKKRWEPRGDRHDFLDCLIYALALARYRRSIKPQSPVKYGVVGKAFGV
jgi:phage terminase large subunit GpA-like protein